MDATKAIKSVYVAGPISKGDMFTNVRNGILFGQECIHAGLVPIVPHLSGLWQMIHPNGYEDWMSLDFEYIRLVDALIRMPGESPGADREVDFALANGIPVFFSLQAVVDHNRRVAAIPV